MDCPHLSFSSLVQISCWSEHITKNFISEAYDFSSVLPLLNRGFCSSSFTVNTQHWSIKWCPRESSRYHRYSFLLFTVQQQHYSLMVTGSIMTANIKAPFPADVLLSGAPNGKAVAVGSGSVKSNLAEPKILWTKRTNSPNWKLNTVTIVFLTCNPWFSGQLIQVFREIAPCASAIASIQHRRA